MNMYKYGNKSNFDFDQGLKVLMKLNESDDFFYNMPLQGAQVRIDAISQDTKSYVLYVKIFYITSCLI